MSVITFEVEIEAVAGNRAKMDIPQVDTYLSNLLKQYKGKFEGKKDATDSYGIWNFYFKDEQIARKFCNSSTRKLNRNNLSPSCLLALRYQNKSFLKTMIIDSWGDEPIVDCR